MKTVKLFFLLMTGLLSLNVQAQRTVQGIVTDSSKEVLIGASVAVKGTSNKTATDENGKFTLKLSKGDSILVIQYVGYLSQEIKVISTTKIITAVMQPHASQMNEVVVTAMAVQREKRSVSYSISTISAQEIQSSGNQNAVKALSGRVPGLYVTQSTAAPSNESYSKIKENGYQLVSDQPLSTFSIDIDRAAYSNVRRYLNSGALPPADAVRIEEMINYFDYKYKSPKDSDVAIYTDMATCPWEPAHQLIRVALKAKELPMDKLPPANLVFLLDVSGSMDEPNKLPLVKQALTALTQQLRSKDKVAIVVYAGAAGVVLPSTHGDEKTTIINALNQLSAGGSTAGGEGLKLAYNIASENFMKNGNNRIIMATDGDFNVGESSEDELEKLIVKERESGISLSVMGFGMGNYKDSKLELLADKGNGNYGYIDNFEEARRTFVTEFGSTLFTVAKDVKLQLEFNPQYVQSYRLVGYENRMLENKDFNDDKKDAGDMGVGHTVTALYEIIPAGSVTHDKPMVDSLKYQHNIATNAFSGEVLTVKLRYKKPDEDKSQLLTSVMPLKVQEISNAPEDFMMAAAVASFGLLLRDSQYKGTASYSATEKLAKSAKGEDEEGYRSEFIQMVKKAAILDTKKD
jgi:Ca-activated chloride channel homolog